MPREESFPERTKPTTTKKSSQTADSSEGWGKRHLRSLSLHGNPVMGNPPEMNTQELTADCKSLFQPARTSYECQKHISFSVSRT